MPSGEYEFKICWLIILPMYFITMPSRHSAGVTLRKQENSVKLKVPQHTREDRKENCMYDILQSSKSASSTQHTRGKYRQTGLSSNFFPGPVA